MGPRAGRNLQAIALLYGAALVYLSLFPFSGWHGADNCFSWLTGLAEQHLSRKDMFVNFLAYLPLGFLSVRCRTAAPASPAAAAVRVCLIGLALSCILETLQSFLPGREPSLVDLVMNGSGSLAGAVLAPVLTAALARDEYLGQLRSRWLQPGRHSSIGAAVLLLWAAGRLAPDLALRYRGGISRTLGTMGQSLQGAFPFHAVDAVVHGCLICGLAVLAVAICHPKARVLRLFIATCVVVLAGRLFATFGGLTLEEVAGTAGGIAAAALLLRLPAAAVRPVAMTVLAGGFVLGELWPGLPGAGGSPINWIPLRYHLDNALRALGQIPDAVWPFSALALFRLLPDREPRRSGLYAGGAVVFAAVLLLELRQQQIPGRTADITQPLLALIGWSWPFFPLLHAREETAGGPPDRADC